MMSYVRAGQVLSLQSRLRELQLHSSDWEPEALKVCLQGTVAKHDPIGLMMQRGASRMQCRRHAGTQTTPV